MTYDGLTVLILTDLDEALRWFKATFWQRMDAAVHNRFVRFCRGVERMTKCPECGWSVTG